MMEIRFSRGKDTFDNKPEQRSCNNFDGFEQAVISDLSPKKGLAFICSPLQSGPHYQKPEKYTGEAPWRLKDNALPRQFIAFDFDGFSSPETFDAVRVFMQRYRGFCYTTASHTEEKPRARVILLANRPMSRDECEKVSETLEIEIELSVGPGEVKFDSSVYRGEQPIYTPVVGAKTFSFQGKAVEVDTLLNISQRRQTAIQFGGSAVDVEADLGLAQAPMKDTGLAAAISGGIGGYDLPDRVNEGDRNSSILAHVGHLRGRGVPEDLIPGMALDFNRSRCRPPLRDDEVLDIVSRYEKQAKTTVVKLDPNDWPEPEELKATLPPVMPFDLLLLPKVFRDWVSDIADRMQCPIEFLAVGAMVASGAAVGNRAGVQPKQLDTGWVEVLNFWGAAVGRPGVMKSPALAQVLMPLRQLESAAQNAFSATQAQYEIDKMKYVADKKVIEAQIKKGATILPNQLPVLPVEPQPQRYLVNDSTYQKLGDVLSGNPHGLLVFQDELSGLLMRLDTNGQEPARAFYLEAWNGQQDYTFDRMERGTVRIPRLCFSLLGGLQPSKLREYLRSAVYGGKGDDGLAQRLQMLVYPDISPKWVQVDRLPDVAAAIAADDVFKRLATLDPIALGARQHYPDSIPVFSFTEDAQVLFNTWWSKLENNLRSEEHHPALESHISKYRKLVPALALLNHLIIGGQGTIGIDSLKRAIGWQEFLLTHATRAYAAVTSATMDSAKALSRHIERGALKDGFTVRNVYRNNWSLLSSVKEAAEAVEVLVDLGWLRVAQDKQVNGTDGRPTVRYFINPRLQAAA
jgi:hypothetical protein